MGKTPVPKFTYPGDDPELDRLLNEARIEGAKELTSFPDMFGRRGEKNETPKAAGATGENGATKKPTVSTRPMVTTTKAPAAAATATASKKQARWLACAVLSIVAPVATLAIGALQSGYEVGSGAGAGAVSALVTSETAVPRMTAVPVIEEDAGAAPEVGVVPSGARAAPSVGAKVWPKIKDDPYDAAPTPTKTVEVVVAPPTPTVAPVPIPVPSGPSPLQPSIKF